MSIDAVLSCFRRVRPVQSRPDRWTCACPVHKGGQERHPSVLLYLNERRHLMGRCYACGARLPEMLFALGKDMTELTNGRKQMDGRRKAVAHYVYRDKSGKPLYRVVRSEPKAFHQERATMTRFLGPGWEVLQWTPGLGDCKRVLYRWNEWATRPNAPVIIVEGEKDADALWDMGLPATCNVGGTGMGWSEEYTHALAGRRAVIIPDSDGPGTAHAIEIAGSLVAFGSLASLRYVPELRIIHGQRNVLAKDVSEYFQQGGTRKTLIDLILAAPEWSTSRAKDKTAVAA